MAKRIRKKLIEVALPLEAINEASAREKSIRHGHPSTLHLWWARRPLAACRAVLFAQAVDDPSAWPERFPSVAEQDAERRRLHRIIADMVPWQAAGDERILRAARFEIARSVAWGLGEEPPAQGDGQGDGQGDRQRDGKDDGKAILAYLQAKAPAVYDPFSGGGSIPVEAQRLGLRAYGSDLNPVAVLIGKALVEIPPKFAGKAPVNPQSQAQLKRGGSWNGKGAEGLAEDVRHYGRWLRDEALKRIGHLYPKAQLEDGSDATVVAWLWARTVRSPDPAAKGAKVPLVSSFLLSTKEGRTGKSKAWVEPLIDAAAPDGWRFEVRTGTLTKEDEERLRKGTKRGRGAHFSCALTGSAISPAHVRRQALTVGLGARLMAIVAEGDRGRIYLPPNAHHEAVAAGAKPRDTSAIEVDMPDNPRSIAPPGYGMKRFVDIFTPRQLVALTTFSDLVAEARDKALADAGAAGLADDGVPLHAGGSGAHAYADAVATYSGLIVGRCADAWSMFASWASTGEFIRNTFARQAISMVWDFAECNPFSASTGNFSNGIEWTSNALAGTSAVGVGHISQMVAQNNKHPVRPVLISTDPPYYDNISYADLSDYFYVWHRRTLNAIWPELYRRLSVPKDLELVATPYRHGGRDKAETFFMDGMGEALAAMRKAATHSEPLAIYYAFKQAEVAEDGMTSAGWASFLQAVVDAGLVVDGTWPIRTERAARTIGVGANVLASSIVLVCRKRDPGAGIMARADFMHALKRELPAAIASIRKAGVGPVDLQQAIIGPGMGVFSRHAAVLEDDDRVVPVKTALSLINRAWEEIDNELVASCDPETQVALAWFGSYGFEAQASGELIMLATAKNTSDRALFSCGVFRNLHGKASLTPRRDLARDWLPASDKGFTVWQCVQHTALVLNAQNGGGDAAAVLIARMGSKADDARALVDRLFRIASDKGWAQEAWVYNQLAEEWPHLLDRAAAIGNGRRQATAGDLFASA